MKTLDGKHHQWVTWYLSNVPCNFIYNHVIFRNYIKHDVTYSDEVKSFVYIELLLRDKRDFSSLHLKYITGKPFTKFEHIVHNYLKRNNYIGTLKNLRIPKTLSWSLVKNAAITLWRALDTDLADTLIELAETDEPEAWLMIAKAKVNPHSAIYHNDSDLFYRDYQAVNFLRKYEGLSAVLNVDTNSEGLNQWLTAERQCKETNEIFRNAGEYFSIPQLRELHAVRMKVQEIIGPSPSIAQVREHLRVGPGATRSCPSKFCSILDKIDNFKTTSKGFAVMANTLIQGTFWDRELVVSEASELAFVAKTALVSRAIEPPEDFDSQAQMALGRLIKIRLKKFGLDIDNQAFKNAHLAKQGSIDGSVATIDLSSASDTISYELIKFLLPKGWFNWLSRLRSQIINIHDPNGKSPKPIPYRLSKFSAMGNGYTFELETLVFLCITLVASRSHNTKTLPENFGVFGDDIICPTERAKSVIELLSLCGFKTNQDKTFIDGPFRESCGADFFMGAPVRPYFLKKELNHVTQLYNVANGIRRVSVRSLNYFGSDIRFSTVWNYIVSNIPKEYRYAGSSDYGDSIIWANPNDDIADLQFAAFTGGQWKGKCIYAIQRGINLYAYSADTVIQSWHMTKRKEVNQKFDNKLRNFQMELTLYENGEGTFSKVISDMARRIDDCSVVQRTFRAHATYNPRYRLSSTNLFTKTDCPIFI